MKKQIVFTIAWCSVIILASCNSKPSRESPTVEKDHLLSLEQNWLKAEFALDTGYLSSITDSSFISISANEVHGKSAALLNMYQNISQRIRDSIIVDSFKLENPVVNLYSNNAVVTFIVHSFRKDKGVRNEHRTRFYDVWVKQDGAWKAVSSQGTTLE